MCAAVGQGQGKLTCKTPCSSEIYHFFYMIGGSVPSRWVPARVRFIKKINDVENEFHEK